MKAYMIKVIGDVQGVNFRYFTKKEAEKLGLSGWVKNEHDGSVSVFVQGNHEGCQKFIEWAREGSPMSAVENIKYEIVEPDLKLEGFESR